MASKVTKRMKWNVASVYEYDFAGDELMGLHTVHTYETLNNIDVFRADINAGVVEKLAGKVSIITDFETREAVREMDTNDFAALAEMLLEGDSRRDKITRTITYYDWKILKLTDEGEVLTDFWTVSEQMTAKQACKKWDAQKAILIDTREILFGMELDTFLMYSNEVFE